MQTFIEHPAKAIATYAFFPRGVHFSMFCRRARVYVLKTAPRAWQDAEASEELQRLFLVCVWRVRHRCMQDDWSICDHACFYNDPGNWKNRFRLT